MEQQTNHFKPTNNQLSQPRPWYFKAAVIVMALAVGVVVYLFADASSIGASAARVSQPFELGAFPIIRPTLRWGFAIDTLEVSEQKIHSGQSLSDILAAQPLSGDALRTMLTNAGTVFDLRKLQAGKSYFVLTHAPSGQPMYLVYEPSPFEYILFHLANDYAVERIEREVETLVETEHFVVNTTLWDAMIGQGYSYDLADRLEDALQWSIDFHRIQEGDEFKVVFENKYVEGVSVAAGQVKGAYYKRGGKEVYAIYYESGEYKGYYDLEGRPLKTAFLKAPVRFSRISSRFSMNRFHPILKYNRPHLGTDYAAPHGTEIMAVGDGVVTEARYSGGNGNYVRIKHDKTYETQYLHMSKFAKGIKAGVRVSQGQVIGYVGSTGLATGPHVCFRFWKNGQQVDHLKLDLPQAKPLPENELPLFEIVKNEVLDKLKAAAQRANDNP